MIKINWSEVQATKERLLRDGATKSFEMIVIVLYYTKSECDKLQITLGELESVLFDLGGNDDIKGVFLYDIDMKKPYLKCEEPERVNSLETVSNSGHSNILLEFNNMSAEGRDVWLEIAMSKLQHYINQGAEHG